MDIQLVLRIMLVFVSILEASAEIPSLVLSECPEKCGNIFIPYPFGIGATCSANYNFTITCNTTPPRPFLADTNVEVVSISIYDGTIRVKNSFIQDVGLPRFILSKNQTTVMDWYTYLRVNSSFSLCGNNTDRSDDGLCYCKYGYDGNPYIVPTGCQEIDNYCSYHDFRDLRYYNGSYHVHNECSQGCINQPGGYSCYCFGGYKLDGDGRWCYPDNKTRTVIIGICSSIGGIILLGVTWWFYKLLQRRKQKKFKEKCFKKNGGFVTPPNPGSRNLGSGTSRYFTIFNKFDN